MSATGCKYLYKYLTKGADRMMVKTEVGGAEVEEPRDEIEEYEDLRSVGSSEATWHLMAYPIARKFPTVKALRVHLKDEQQVVFTEGDEEKAAQNQKKTELTAFFEFNRRTREEAERNGTPYDPKQMPRYVDMPKEHVYEKGEWRKRKGGSDATIGRVHSVNPLAGEVYFLRMLLHDDHCRGKESFRALRRHTIFRK